MHDPVEAFVEQLGRDLIRCCLLVAIAMLLVGSGLGFLLAHFI